MGLRKSRCDIPTDTTQGCFHPSHIHDKKICAFNENNYAMCRLWTKNNVIIIAINYLKLHTTTNQVAMKLPHVCLGFIKEHQTWVKVLDDY